MSFTITAAHGPANDINVSTTYGEEVNERQDRVVELVEKALVSIARELGGHVAVSATGHVNDYEGGVGDNVNLQVNSVLAPPEPVKDAGLDAAGGSPRNFPPEASTAAPATEDASPPADQKPLPEHEDVPESKTEATPAASDAPDEPAPTATDAASPSNDEPGTPSE